MRRILLGAGLVSICTGSLVAWPLWSQYAASRAAARTEASNLTAVFAWELTTSLDAADARMRAVAQAIKLAAPGEPIESVAELDGDLVIAGPDGRIMVSTANASGSPVDVSQQAHFITHRDHPAAGLIVDPFERQPYPDRFEVSRRLEYANGRFAGEAIVRLRQAAMLALYRHIDMGPGGMIAVVDAHGIVRAGYDRDHPDGLFGIGTDLADQSYLQQTDPGGTAFYTGRFPLGSARRRIAIRRLARYDLSVLVALEPDDVLGAARLGMLLIVLAAIAGTGLLATPSLLLIREVGRRTNRKIGLAGERDRLRSAQIQIREDRARLAEASRELLASRESAEAAGRARSQFLAHMSHELRTPLHAIIGFSELIQDQAPTRPGSPPIAGYAADILDSGRHLLELINSILDISKVESGTAMLAESAFPVGDLLRKSLEVVRGQAVARSITIASQLPETRWRVRADRIRLSKVLINLLSNAVKFTPDHGRVILNVAESANGELVFTVIDAGIGMTEAEIAIALEPFGQVDSTFARLFDGTGLGLPLARKLIELHGGRLELDSVKGQGTTARVILPAERLVYRGVVRAGGE